MRWTQRLAHLIAPPVCVLCGADGQSLEEPWGLDLCAHCQAACPRAGPEPPPFDTAFCLFRYEDPVDQMIVRLKFQHELAQARVLGTLFAQAYRASRRPLPQCLVPMPLHPSRYRERGFCQTRELARHIARRLRVPRGHTGAGRSHEREGAPPWRAHSLPLPVSAGLLHRTRATRAQSGLNAADRASNLEHAFTARISGAPPCHVALLDDVLTTGQTALAAIAALRAAGVQRVDLWVIARAALRDDTARQATGPGTPI